LRIGGGEDRVVFLVHQYAGFQAMADPAQPEVKKFYSGNDDILTFAYTEGFNNCTGVFKLVSLGVTKIYAEAISSKVRTEITVTVKNEPPVPGVLGFYGSGTEDEPYLLSDDFDIFLVQRAAMQLQWGLFKNGEEELVGNYFEGVYFKLTNDIVYDVIVEEYGGEVYINTIRQIYVFNGIFDGNGYTITVPEGVKKQNAWTQYDMGLFYILGETAVVKNLTLDMELTVAEFNPEDLDDFHTDIENGLIATYNNGTIENCVVKGSLTVKNRASYAYGNWFTLGGIVAKNYGTIENCISGVDIIIDGYANSRNSENKYYDAIGGLVGYNGGILRNCIYTGGIKYKLREGGSKYYIGALIGIQDGEYDGFSIDFVNDLYYDFNILDIRTQEEAHPDSWVDPYNFPQTAIGKTYGETGERIGGVSDWSSIDFSSWDGEVWDFSGDMPELKIFKK
jgi:hypothetical protein